MLLLLEEEQMEFVLTFHPGADEAVIPTTDVIVPLAAHQVTVSHRHTMFLLRTTRKPRAVKP